MAGRDNTYRDNCIKDNGQYGINACCGGHSATSDIANFVLDRNFRGLSAVEAAAPHIESSGCREH